jgi:hypothetical protein
MRCSVSLLLCFEETHPLCSLCVLRIMFTSSAPIHPFSFALLCYIYNSLFCSFSSTDIVLLLYTSHKTLICKSKVISGLVILHGIAARENCTRIGLINTFSIAHRRPLGMNFTTWRAL